ncbi:MAG: hypothetical protein QXL96_11270 [Ignisphaera sp.]
MSVDKMLIKMFIYGAYVMFLATIGLAIVVLYPSIRRRNIKMF